jgi:hypothetical protein
MMTVPRLLLSTLLVPLLAMPSGAQRIAPAGLRLSDGAPAAVTAPPAAVFAAPRDTEPAPVRGASVTRTVIGGVVGGVIGTFVGALAGSGANSGCQGDLCGLEGALIGVLIGEPLGLAIGANAGSGTMRPERILLTSLASVGILVGGVAAGVGMSRIGGPAGAIMIPAIPVLQLVTAVAIEAR